MKRSDRSIGHQARSALAALAILGMLATACGDDDDSSASPDVEGSATTSPDDAAPADGAELPEGDTSFTVAFPATPGFSDVPLLVTIDELNADGWDIDTTVINDTGVQTEALVSGQIQMTASNSIPALQAIQLGQDLVMLGERSLNDWLVVARTDVESCQDMAGETVAYHSEASPSTFMLRTYMEENCPGTEANFVIMEGSSNRAAALVDGQIGATVVQVEDWVAATGGDNDDVHILGNLGTELGDLITSSYVAQREWAVDNEAVLTEFFSVLLTKNRELGGDPDALVDAAVDVLDAADPDTLQLIIDAYGDNPFLEDGGMSRDRVEYTLAFLEEADALEPGLDAGDVVYRAPLEAALEEL